jgi:hypothetical protein
MARSRSWGLVALSLAVTLTAAHAAQAQTQSSRSTLFAPREARPAAAEEMTCTVYTLAGLSEDPGFGKWVAETVPDVIEPGTWAQDGAGRRKLSYYAPGKVLVVYHTPAVQAKVAAFLRDLQKAAPQQHVMAPADETPPPPLNQAIMPARYTVSEQAKASAALAADKSGYLVPAPVKQPKHLFHLILRYEGQGVSDSAVAGIVTQLGGEVTPAEEQKAGAAPAKGMQQNALLNFIVRYEGEGIIDSNVASLVKDLYKMNLAGESGARYSSGPAPACSAGSPPYISPASYAVPTNVMPPGVVNSGSGVATPGNTTVGQPITTGSVLPPPTTSPYKPGVSSPTLSGPAAPASNPVPRSPVTMPPAR